MKNLIIKKKIISQIILFTFIFVSTFLYNINSSNPQTQKQKNELNWRVQIIFGISGPKPIIWDGRALISEGSIENIQGFNFTDNRGLTLSIVKNMEDKIQKIRYFLYNYQDYRI